VLGQMELPDESWQIAVLSRVLALHPERLSDEELRREMVPNDEDFSQTDAYDRAVRDLTAAGLVRRDGGSVIPTRAAVHFYSFTADY
jgi:hypothetical protein